MRCSFRSLIPEFRDVYSCEKFGECTPREKRNGIACCAGCELFVPSSEADAVQPRLNPVIGITTAPRKDGLLDRCVSSLQVAGGKDITIFAEPGSDLSGVLGTRVVQREARFGAWRNWVAMCRELLKKEGDLFLLCQDDMVFSSSALSIEVPNKKFAFISLYAASHYAKKYQVIKNNKVAKVFQLKDDADKHAKRIKGTVRMKEAPHGIVPLKTNSFWGACALLFQRKTLESFLNHRIVRTWKGARRAKKPELVANIDTAIGLTANSLGLQMLICIPSLCQHEARYSSIGHGGNEGRRKAWSVADDLKAESKCACAAK